METIRMAILIEWLGRETKLQHESVKKKKKLWIPWL